MDKEIHYRKLENAYLLARINKFFNPTIKVSEAKAEIIVPIKKKFFHYSAATHGCVYFKSLDDAAYFAVQSLNFDNIIYTSSFNIFIIQNNHWAISVPFEKQTATETIAEKAAAYAIDGARVDGNDVFAVYKTVKKYADQAREKHKPALIELVTYRMGDHTTADDATRYRKPEIIAEWEKRDPISRLRTFLMINHGWTEEKENKLIEKLSAEVEKAVQEYESIEHPDPTNMFKYIYSEMPWHLKEQMEEVRAIR